MNCRDAVRSIDARIDGALPDAERADLEAHLGSCPRCRQEMDERRAFADHLGRSLYFALRSVSPAPGVKERCARALMEAGSGRAPRRPWIPLAAAAGLALAVVGALAAAGLFSPSASPEARELAELRSRRDRAQGELMRLASAVKDETRDLDARVDAAPPGALRDAGALWVASSAARLAGSAAPSAGRDPREHVRGLARQLADPDLDVRGRAVWGFRQLGGQHAVALREMLPAISGGERAFAEMVLQSIEGADRPAIELSMDADGRELRVVQYADARIRIVQKADGEERVTEARSLAELRARFPKLVEELQILGTDGDFAVGELHQSGPARLRPVMYLDDAVWAAPAAAQEGLVLKMTGEAIVVDLVREGVAPAEAERRALETLQKLRAETWVVEVSPAAADSRRHLAETRALDPGELQRQRGQVSQEIRSLEQRIEEMRRQVTTLRKAKKALEAARK